MEKKIENKVKKTKKFIIELEEKDHYFIKRRVLDLGLTMREYVLQALLEKITRDLQYQ